MHCLGFGRLTLSYKWKKLGTMFSKKTQQ